MSEVSERLLSSAVSLGEMPSGALLLKDNALYPWFLIVPRGDFVEWMDLPHGIQGQLLQDLNTLSDFLLRDPELAVDKINIGAIGNIVPQFHLHIVGRRHSDPAWPGPVWGHPDHEDYFEGDVERFKSRLAAAVSDFRNGG